MSNKTKTNYDDQLLKLLAMRCLYNFDEITQDQMKETFNFLEEKYSKKDLEFLRQIGDIAREFQTEYNSIKEQDSTYQRTK